MNLTPLRLCLLSLASALAALAQTAAPAPDLASNPAATAAQLNPALPSIFIAGDSTAARGRGERQQGWAEPFAGYFDSAKVNIVNRARGGRSSRTFISSGEWDQLLALVKKGDTVLIQFGHNDGSVVNEDPATPRAQMRSRGSLPGLGEETREIVNVLTQKPEVVHTYGWYLRKMIADVKAKDASPIVLSLTLRHRWAEGKIERGSGHFSAWAFDVAKAAAVPFVDLMNTQADAFDALGEAKVKALYPQDHTHFNAEGADLHAQTVVALLKGLRPTPTEGLLSAKGQAIAADKFSWLRLPRPINPHLPSLVLVGDSTVRNGRGDGVNGQWGWGDFLAPYLDTEKLNIVNRAVGGTGVRTFTALGHWAAALALVKPGDVVMIQFGHNDNGDRAPLKGLGEETAEREDPKTKERYTEHTWGWHLRRYLADIRAKGATPIVCTLIPRKMWLDGKINRPTDSHADWARAIAKTGNVALIDLNEKIAQRYEALGEAAVATCFADERVHTSKAGAELNAEIVVSELRALQPNPLAPYLRPTTK